MNKEIKIIKLMKKEKLSWKDAEKKQEEIKTLEEF